MGLAIGIDLGTTNSVAAVATPAGVEFVRGKQGERTHPSVVAYLPGDRVLVGTDARLQRLTGGDHVVCSAKRLIGQSFNAPMLKLAIAGMPFKVEIGDNQQPIAVVRDQRVTMPEVSGAVLAYLRRLATEQFGEPVTHAVITVPANFTDAQRRATKEAGRLAGLDVLRLINEPTAAAVAYGAGKGIDEIICVFDFGGGTLDVSLLRIRDQVFEVLASDGDFFLGGDDLDATITEHLATTMNRQLGLNLRGNAGLMNRLTMAAESIKCRLSEHEVAEGEIEQIEGPDGALHALPFHLTRAHFEAMISPLVERAMDRCQQVLRLTGLAPQRISEVLCVGGTTRIPLVQRRLAEVFQRPPSTRIDPDAVVAQGAAIQAGSLSGRLFDRGRAGNKAAASTPASRPLLLDVAPATLGIQTAGGFAEPILLKNIPIPIERTRVFTTAADDQDRVVIECCRGDARRYEDNEHLGTLELTQLPPRPRGEPQIEVTFSIDHDGILSVRAEDLATGAMRHTRLTVIGAPTEPTP
ncbi:MAG: Hsp70 family protein [Kofleriaceae bacterium]